MLPLSHREIGERSGRKKRDQKIKRPTSQHNPAIASSFSAAAIACTRSSQDWAYQQPILDQGVAHETINPYLTPGYSGREGQSLSLGVYPVVSSLGRLPVDCSKPMIIQRILVKLSMSGNKKHLDVGKMWGEEALM